MLKKLFLYFNTIKYLKPVQIYGRVYSKIKSKITKNYTAPNTLEINLKFKTDLIQHDPWNNRTEILNGDFKFLNKKINLSFPPNWNPEADLLWNFNLHYFHYIYLLNDDEKEKIVLDWIENNPVGIGTGWHPYVISLRLINWIREDFKNEEIVKSIYIQTEFLYKNLEFYHPANHYVENAKALIFAGKYFSENNRAKKWLSKGQYIFKKELPKQVLKDGTYFEITPMYHAKVLEGLLDIINILNKQNEFSNFLNEYIHWMLIHFVWTTHPDGNISLINDSTHEIVPSTEKIIKYAEDLGFECKTSSVKTENHKYFNESGIGILRNKEYYFVIKAGQIGPDEIPAHAHADIFSYELSILGKQFIVDSGVYEYISGEMREYCRGTKAHNTVEIDGTNQCEVWGSHRVGRRFKPKNIIWEESKDSINFSGTYDGYNSIIGDNLVHQREVEFNKTDNSLSIIDIVKGSGIHSAVSYIHLHPGTTILENNKIILLAREETKIELSINAEFSIEDSWYCPEFSKKIKNKVISIILPLNGNISYIYKVLK